MKNLIVFYDDSQKLTTKLEDIAVPSDLQPNDVLIKVEVAGSNPKDWKHPLPAYFNNKLNQGDDCAGTIAAVGSAVKSFHVGDRVAGFHEMDTPNGTYAEYTICPEQTVFHIPDSMSYEEAATMPLTVFTAAVGLYRNLGIPAPWDRSDGTAPDNSKVALVVNAASGAVGAFAVKLAKLNPRIGPIIATAGSSADYVKSLGVDAVVDYRSPTAADDIRKAAGDRPIRHVFDGANTVASVTYETAVLAKGGRYVSTTSVTANKAYGSDNPMEKMLKDAEVWYEQIWVGDVHEQKIFGSETVRKGGKVFGAVMSRTIEKALAEGSLTGHPYEVVENGLDGVLTALHELQHRKKGGNAKFVTRIGETPGLNA